MQLSLCSLQHWRSNRGVKTKLLAHPHTHMAFNNIYQGLARFQAECRALTGDSMGKRDIHVTDGEVRRGWNGGQKEGEEEGP